MGTLIVATLAGLFVMAVVLALIRRSIRMAAAPGVDPRWLTEFSVESYGPMTRLLNEEDYRFLASQKGYEPGLAKKLRRERRIVLKMYLSSLGSDFNRLHRAARVLAVYAPDTNIASTLLSSYVTFWWGMVQVRARLLVPGVSVDVAGLLVSVSSVRQRLAPVLPAA